MAKKRIIEIDLLRTIAIIMMIVFHIAFDLYYFYGFPIDLFGSVWQSFRILTASLFLIVAGIATNFTAQPLRRAGIVLSCAALISMVTYIYDPKTFIYFGILHCIGLGMLVLIPLKRLKEFTILIGLALALAPALSPLRPTLDFYPPIPWIGLMLIGYGVGHYLYVRNNFRLPITINQSLITFPGRHSLIIYMIHQPIILGILYLIYIFFTP